jgi:hypothetical protein
MHDHWDFFGAGVQRIEVPGGWLYRADCTQGMTFVPHPSSARPTRTREAFNFNVDVVSQDGGRLDLIRGDDSIWLDLLPAGADPDSEDDGWQCVATLAPDQARKLAMHLAEYADAIDDEAAEDAEEEEAA